MARTDSIKVAQEILDQFYVEEIEDIDLIEIASYYDIIVQDVTMKNADGRIVFGKEKAIISINENISYSPRKRFTLAHELGHYFLHREDIHIHNDNFLTLDTFKAGSQETEANLFASELLMPQKFFIPITKSEPFSPDLLRRMSTHFNSSLTSVVFKYQQFGNHPIFIFFCRNNKVEYWIPPHDFFIKVKDIKNLTPPFGSVAYEFFSEGTIYPAEESKQYIFKSEWFELNYDEVDSEVCEYCIVSPNFNTALSVVWIE
ncbi:MAG: ImmA/IrrE family metallo-endopeptidase [Bacteroidales bacterium]